MNSHVIRNLFRSGAVLLLVFCLSASVAFASTVTVYYADGPCWSTPPYCPNMEHLTDCSYLDYNGNPLCPFDFYYDGNGNIHYLGCYPNHPYYCPSNPSWTYQKADSVDLSSSPATLSSNYLSPLTITEDSPINITSIATGAAYPTLYQYNLYVSQYDWNSGAWSADSLLQSGTSTGSFPWNWTPTQPGRFTLRSKVRANYVWNWDDSSPYYYFDVRASTPLSIQTASLPGGTVGQPYPTTTLLPSGGVAPYTWECYFEGCNDIGSCGLSFSSSGVLSGTPTCSPGAFGVKVSDSQHPPDTAINLYALNIAVPPPTISTTSLPIATAGAPYSAPLSATAGELPYTWIDGSAGRDIYSSIPPGLSLNTTTGVISGTPGGWTGPHTFTIQLKDNLNQYAPSKVFTIYVYPQLTIDTSSPLPNGTVGIGYSQTVSASGGNSNYNWSVSSGSLPSGLNLTKLNATTGLISGIPSAACVNGCNFTVKATDTQSPTPVTTTKPFFITIYDQLRDTSVMGTSPKIGVPYSFQLSAAGGKAPYYWTKISGNLPTGLTLNQSTGLISGTPSVLGNFSCTINTSDSQGTPASINTVWNFSIAYDPVTITNSNILTPGNVGIAYSNFINVTGGDGSYSWSQTSGTLPTGISLNTATGELYGTPTTGGDYSFTITANDGLNPTASKTFTLKINAPPSIANITLVDGQYGVAYNPNNQALSAGTGNYLWSISGAPDGLTIGLNSGIISGIPTNIGQFTVSIQAADAQNLAAYDIKSFTLTIKNSLTQNSQNSSVIGCEATPLVCTNSTTDVISGIVNHDQELFTTKGGMQNIAISLFYKSLPGYNGSLGIGWSHNYDIFLTIYSSGDGSIVLNTGSGDKHYYTKNGSNYDSSAGDTSVLTAVSGGYKITYRDGSSYNFNSDGKITSIADRFGNAISFEYTDGDLTKITDPAYRVAILTYDQTVTPHRILSIISPDAITYPGTINNSDSTYIFSYNGNNLYRVTNPAATTGAVQGYWEYQYNADGLLKSKRDPNGNISQYTYYADKRMQTATDPNGRTRTIVYPPSTGTLRTSTLTEKDGGQWLYTYNSTTGAITQKTDPNSKTTDFYYYTSGASNGFIKAKTEPKDGATRLTTFYAYDGYGNLKLETEPSDIAPTDPATVTEQTILGFTAARRYVYDNAAGHYDRITSIADERGTTTLTTSFVYSSDAYGEVVTATATPGNYETVTRKNTNGSIRQLTDANGKTTSFFYQQNYPSRQANGIVGLPESINAPDGTWTTFDTYDKKGNPYHTTILDSTNTSRLGIFTTHDKLGRLTDILKYPNTPVDSFESQYSYDLVGNLTSEVDAEINETKYEYNYNRQITKITDAKLNETVFKYSGSELNGIDQLVGVFDANVSKNTPLDSQPHTAYQYDQLGRLDTETDPLGKRLHYTYYDNGHLKEKYDATNSTPGTLLVTFYYNNRGQITDKVFTDGTYEHYTYTANGQLETAGNQNIVYTFAYYTDGRLQSVTDNSSPANRKITYDQYDALGQRKQVTILKDAGADQRIISYDYDTANRPWHITSNFGTPAAKTFTYAYDNLGRRDTLAYPNGTSADWDFDDLNRLTALTHKNGTTPFAAFNYNQHDYVGNRKSITGSRNETYGYDELYRVTSLTAATNSEGFTYDPAGNRLTGPGASDTFYQSNAANQMTQGRKLAYGYDNRGNQTTKTVPGAADKTWTRTWDYNNRLTQEQKIKGTEVKTVIYKYDPFGRRIEKKFQQTKGGVTETETTNYVYDNEDIVVEYFTTSAGTEKTFYTHGPGIDEPLALERDGIYYYFHADGLGSITHITNSDKTAVQSYTYDAYGMATASSDFRNSYQYAGYIWDWETGTYHVRERTYDPTDGVLTSKDPIGMAGGDVNLYRYVEGQPINFVDPSGLSRIDPGGLLERPFAGGGGISSGAGNLAVRSGGGSASATATELSAAAKCAANKVGSGRGPVYGTKVHSAFEPEVKALGRANLAVEQSYLNGELVPRGTRGSVRADVIEGPLNSPTAIYDLKTGNATLTPARIRQLQQHILGGPSDVPILEIRP